jgi:hypothetical protein
VGYWDIVLATASLARIRRWRCFTRAGGNRNREQEEQEEQEDRSSFCGTKMPQGENEDRSSGEGQHIFGNRMW